MSVNRVQLVVSTDVPEPQEAPRAAAPYQDGCNESQPCDLHPDKKTRRLSIFPRSKAIV